jgi:alkylation response protein AidB-like acyl-CoA dehydrogenase
MMHLALSAEQLEVAAVAEKFLANELPLPTVRALADADAPLAIDDATWRRCADMGWFALGVPESRGGVGFGPVEEFALFRELGRRLSPGPFIPTVIAGWVAAAIDNAPLATDLFAGARRAGLVVDRYVYDGEVGGLAVDFDDDSCRVTTISSLDPRPSVDASVRLAVGELGETIAECRDPLLLSRAQILVAATQLGIADAVRDMSIEYAKERVQFGKPIGTFQAVKHRCADMAMRSHAATAQTLFAAFHVASRAEDSAFQAAAAVLVANKAANSNAADNIQNHGAIGFTVEHDAGLFARRAHVLEHALGGQTTAAPVVLAPERHTYAALPSVAEDWFAATE